MKSKVFTVVLTALTLVTFGYAVFAQTTDPNTFVYVSFGDPDTLDPAYAYDTASGELLHQLYDTLVAYGKGGVDTLMPMLSTEGRWRLTGLLWTALAVSYTHLDVYKRQVQGDIVSRAPPGNFGRLIAIHASMC